MSRLGDPVRLVGVDAARAVALVGMMSVHIYPSLRGDGSVHPAYLLAAGRAAALFAVLAGVGLALAHGRAVPPRGRELWADRAGVVCRAGVLVAVGALLGRVDSPPLVILVNYGALFLGAIFFLGLGARALWAWALAWVVLAPAVSFWLRSGPAQPSPELLLSPLEPPQGGLDDLLLTSTYPVLPWLTYVLVGLALGRSDLRRPGVAVRLLVGGVLVAVVAKVASALALAAAGGVAELQVTAPPGPLADQLASMLRIGLRGTTPTTDWRWQLIAAPHSSTTFDLLHTCGTSVAVLGACFLLVPRLPRPARWPLVAAGSMTLTLYTAHVLALQTGSPLLSGSRSGLWLAHVAVALVVAAMWRRDVGRGPLEALAALAGRLGRRLLAGGGRPIAPAGVPR